MKTPEEKLAELSVLVGNFKDEIPNIQHSVSEIYNTLTREQMNIQMLTKQYDRLVELVDKFKEVQFEIQKLDETSKKFINEMENIKHKVEEVSNKEQICESMIKQYHSGDGKTKWTLEKVLALAPNMIAVIGFVAYLCWTVFFEKAKTGGLL